MTVTFQFPINKIGTFSNMARHFQLALFVMYLTHNTNCEGATIHLEESYNFPQLYHNNLQQYQYQRQISQYMNSHNNQGYNREENPKNDDSMIINEIQQTSRSSANARFSREGVEHGKSYVVTLYHWNNHLGRPVPMEWSDEDVESRKCKELPEKSRGKVRSVNTHGNCVVLYARGSCRGPFRVLKPGSPSHNRLSDLCFHKRPLSARPCTEEERNDTNII